MRCVSLITLATVATAASAASRFAARKNVDRPDPANLDHCPGRPLGEADKCTFEKQSDLPDRRRWFILGSPVANCDDPDAPDLSTTVGGERTVTETWEHSNSVGIDLFGIKIGGEGGWSESTSQTQRQSITVTIPNGKQRVALVGVNHKESQGRIRLNYGDPTGPPGANDYHFIWFQNDIVSSQPTDDVEFDSAEINCGETFDPSNL